MYLFGASGHGKVVADIIKTSMPDTDIKAVYDDKPCLDKIADIPVFEIDLDTLNRNAKWIISIGNNAFRKKVSQRIKGEYLKAIHKSATVSRTSEIGEGTVVMANAVINPEAKIGEHCIINTGAVIEHDCVVGDFAHISPNAALAGGVRVGEGTQVGIGAVVIQEIKIGKWATIGAGAVIIHDVPDYATVVGNPGKIIKGL